MPAFLSLHSSRRKTSTVSGAGEERIIARARRLFSGGARPAPGVVRGIDDDAAVLAPAGRGWLELLAIDTIVEGTHFAPATPPGRIGRKALAVNISDIAAMGGIPMHAVVSLTLTGREPLALVGRLMAGIAEMAGAHGVTVVGGDTVGGPALSITIALRGRVEPSRVCYRSGARPGDLVAVTGRLGGSFASGRHLDFMPRAAEARWLVSHAQPSSMMDLSDGLALDAHRMACASGVALHLDASAIPVARGSSLDAALHEGEDFELLCCFPAGRISGRETGIFARKFSVTLSVIGEVRKGAPGVFIDGGKLTPRGFDHFGPEL
ncbi:MAG TPA: thiamine-phosphate kinase [Phycisphaerae bacterium]|nr:thiamine-phosphate kinase [Phycisphaerae bacterium]